MLSSLVVRLGRACVNVSGRRGGRAAMALLAAGLAVGLAAAVIPPFFPTNDDTTIQQVLAGSLSGSPTPYGALVNWAFGYLLAGLFTVAPGVPWWSVTHVVVLACSVALVNDALVAWGRDVGAAGAEGGTAGAEGGADGARGLAGTAGDAARPGAGAAGDVALLLATLVALDATLFSAFVGRLQFTTTSSVALSSSMFWVLSQARREEGRRSCRRLLRCAPALVLFVVGFCFRKNSGQTALVVWAAFVAAACIALLGRARRRGDARSPEGGRRLRGAVASLVGPLLVASALCGLLYAADAAAYSVPAWRDYRSFAKVVSNFTDYPHASYEEEADTLVALGWDEDFYELATGWYYLDPRFDEASVRSVNEANDAALSSLLAHPKSTLVERLRDVTRPVPLAYGCLFLAVALLAMGRPGRFGALAVWAVLAGTFALLAYLLVRGRLIDRSMYAAVLPALAVLASVALRGRAAGVGPTAGSRSTSAPGSAAGLGSTAGPLAATVEGPGPEADDDLGEVAAPARGDLGLRVLAVLTLLLCAGLALVASWRGRALLAALAALSLSVLVRGEGAARARGARCSVVRAGSAVLLSLLLVAPGALSVLEFGRGSGTYEWFMWQERNVQEFFSIARENPGTLFVQAGCDELSMQNPWRMDWPVNQTSWAAWYYPAPWFDETLRGAGFSGRPYVDDLFSDDVRLVTDPYTDVDLYLRYLRRLFGDSVRLEEERTFGEGLTVWRVVR